MDYCLDDRPLILTSYVHNSLDILLGVGQSPSRVLLQKLHVSFCLLEIQIEARILIPADHPVYPSDGERTSGQLTACHPFLSVDYIRMTSIDLG